MRLDLTLSTAPPPPVLHPPPPVALLLAIGDRLVAALARVVHLVPWPCAAQHPLPPTAASLSSASSDLAVIIDLRERVG
jgi:hypothetical protein